MTALNVGKVPFLFCCHFLPVNACIWILAEMSNPRAKKRTEVGFKRLSLAKKVEIIHAHANGSTNKNLAEQYRVVHGTITRIISNKEKHLANFEKAKNFHGNIEHTTVKSLDTDFDNAMYHWFIQKRHAGEPINGPLLREKAKDLYSKITGKDDFRASEGWLTRFKGRHGIRSLTISRERLSANTEEVEKCRQWISKDLNDKNVNLDNVYNADETGLYWRSLPNKTLAGREEAAAPGMKANKERITVLMCANSTGTHRIPLLIVGKSAKPRCFRNKHYMPIKYDWQKSAWMDRRLFLNWYQNVFLVEVKSRKPDENERFMLILDNAPSHPPLEELNAIDPRCKVVYLPPTVSSIIQPMEQGCIAVLKRKYKSAFLRELLVKDTLDIAGVVEFLNSWSLYDCCTLVADCWESLREDTLKKCWKQLLISECVDNYENSVSNISQAFSVVLLLNQLPHDQLYTVEEAQEWMNEDTNLQTFEVLNDDEIVRMFTTNEPRLEEHATDDERMSDEEGGQSADSLDHYGVLSSLQKVCAWSKAEPSLTVLDCQILDKLRRLINRKIVSSSINYRPCYYD